MRRQLIVITIAASMVVLTSCSFAPTYRASKSNPRVIQRDLSSTLIKEAPPVPTMEDPVPAVVLPQGPIAATPAEEWHPLAEQSAYFVQFNNESAELDASTLPLEELKARIVSDVQVIVIGQSHGPSAVGTQRLSVMRAERVARALRDASIDPTRIHTLASWGSFRKDIGPSRGVNIFLLRETSPEWQALLSLPSLSRTASEGRT